MRASTPDARAPIRRPCAGGLLRLAAAGAVLMIGCTSGGKNESVPVTSSGINANFTPAAAAGCPGVDMLSMQKGPTLGSTVNIDITVTDCDASMQMNGLSLELNFDDTLLNFIGCSAGSLFPKSQLGTGTPKCISSNGDVLGTIAMQLPSSIRVSGGTSSVLRLTFSVSKRGVATPISFVGTDSIQNTALWFADPTSQSVLLQGLGAGGYAGGMIVTN
jgi:hypothetical protein